MGLSVGWDCRGRGGEGGVLELVIVHIFVPPLLYPQHSLPSCIASPSSETCAGQLELHWRCHIQHMQFLGSHFSSVLLANIFHRQTACSECFERSTVCFWRASPQDVLLQSEERCRCALRFSISFPRMSVVLSSLSTECLDLGHVGHKTKYVQNVHRISQPGMCQPNQSWNKTIWMY